MTKSQIVTSIADSTGLSKKQVGAVMDELENLIERSIKKRAVGEFTMPGLMKITTVKKPARKARKGINPFTGEETTFQGQACQRCCQGSPVEENEGIRRFLSDDGPGQLISMR